MAEVDREILSLKECYGNLADLISKPNFSDFPLSEKTLKGLFESNYIVPTEIQREGILAGLLGRDVVGVAETGSGKTLAFLIPVLEHLYKNKWTRGVGLAALIISPTRELAYQLFETLRRVGKHHDFSAGLIIGGKNMNFEKFRMDKCNILICTPGRLLQHMDENPLFDACGVEILVLDEADRCLDFGFEQCINAVIKNLPSKRQTFLFSATENLIFYLNRLNIRNPIYIGNRIKSSLMNNSIPQRLNQNYIVAKLEEKTSILFSFIKSHLKQKVIVFLATCKQVKYIYEVFSKLRPGVSLLALYGSLNQDRRINIYNEFVKKSHGVLFATDVASRGLDFPDVNWVVQLDCPEDVTQYIHRAGRSARNNAYGESLLVLMPSEENGMVMELKAQNITLCKLEIDQKKLFSPELKIQAFCVRSPDLKASAQRAFIAYIKSIHLMKNKHIFDVSCLNFDSFGKSLGLAATPRIRFIDRILKKNSYKNLSVPQEDDWSENDWFIKIKHSKNLRDDDVPKVILSQKNKIATKISLAKKSIKKHIQMKQIWSYNEAVNDIYAENEGAYMKIFDSPRTIRGLDLNAAKSLLYQKDKYDKLRFKDAVKSQRKKLKKISKINPSRNENMSSGAGNSDENGEEISVPKSRKSVIKIKKIDEDSQVLSYSQKPEKCKTVENISLRAAEDVASELLHLT